MTFKAVTARCIGWPRNGEPAVVVFVEGPQGGNKATLPFSRDGAYALRDQLTNILTELEARP